MESGSTEMSVRYDAARKKWIAVLVDPAGLFNSVSSFFYFPQVVTVQTPAAVGSEP
jgi:hypothetical protein